MTEEMDGQLPLFEVGDAVIVRTYTTASTTPIAEQTHIDFIPWTEFDPDDEG